MSDHPQQSAPIPTMIGRPVTVTGRPVREGHQLTPEIVITDATRAEILHLTPDGARALADALRELADHAEGR